MGILETAYGNGEDNEAEAVEDNLLPSTYTETKHTYINGLNAAGVLICKLADKYALQSPTRFTAKKGGYSLDVYVIPLASNYSFVYFDKHGNRIHLEKTVLEGLVNLAVTLPELLTELTSQVIKYKEIAALDGLDHAIEKLTKLVGE